MSILDKRITDLVEQQVPQFIAEDHIGFTEFMKAYYEFLESSTSHTTMAGILVEDDIRPIYGSKKLLDYSDIDSTLEQFIYYFQFEFLPNIPEQVLCNKRLLLKHVKDFYTSRGSANAWKFLFRILYNEDVDIEYPRDFILSTDSGVYVEDNSIKVQKIDSFDIALYVGTVVSSADSFGIVERIEELENGDYELFFEKNSVVGRFPIGAIVSSGVPPYRCLITTSITKYPGKYLNDKGFLDSRHKLRDDYYYQEYSYVIKNISVYINDFKSLMKRLVHPAGMICFSRHSLDSSHGLPIVTDTESSMSFPFEFSAPKPDTKIHRFANIRSIAAIDLNDDGEMDIAEEVTAKPFDIVFNEDFPVGEPIGVVDNVGSRSLVFKNNPVSDAVKLNFGTNLDEDILLIEFKGEYEYVCNQLFRSLKKYDYMDIAYKLTEGGDFIEPNNFHIVSLLRHTPTDTDYPYGLTIITDQVGWTSEENESVFEFQLFKLSNLQDVSISGIHESYPLLHPRDSVVRYFNDSVVTDYLWVFNENIPEMILSDNILSVDITTLPEGLLITWASWFGEFKPISTEILLSDNFSDVMFEVVHPEYHGYYTVKRVEFNTTTLAATVYFYGHPFPLSSVTLTDTNVIIHKSYEYNSEIVVKELIDNNIELFSGQKPSDKRFNVFSSAMPSYYFDVIKYTGTANNTVFTVSGAGWTTDMWVNQLVTLYKASAPATRQLKLILDSDATTITVDSAITSDFDTIEIELNNYNSYINSYDGVVTVSPTTANTPMNYIKDISLEEYENNTLPILRYIQPESEIRFLEEPQQT